MIESKIEIPDDIEIIPEEERELLQQEAREMGITRGMYSPQRKPKPSARALKKQVIFLFEIIFFSVIAPCRTGLPNH